ncbi:hypothetical protein SDC9_105770 [bioreactor metagenome]|uniref:Uncharacterized protein n=1 Tax=bioreactor metagenome TaxID=1076179 RepID=A0A645B0E0_9ZZZZ
MTILAAAAALADIAHLRLDGRLNALLIGNLRIAYARFHMEFANQTIHDDLQMQLAHSGDDGLPGVSVRIGTESRILLRQFDERDAHLFLAGLGLGLNGNLDDGIRELHALEKNLMALHAERVARAGVLHADEGYDIARVRFFNLGAGIGMHHHNAANALALILTRVIDIGSALERPAVYADERKLTDKRVGENFECQRCKRGIVARLHHNLALAVLVRSLGGFDVQRTWQIVHNRVEQGLNALVTIGCTTGDRYDSA